MLCLRCSHRNADDARFCEECGAELARICSCGTHNTATAKFCKQCRAALRSEAETADRDRITSDGERRQLTVMFADLADSTPMSGRLDPEDLRDAVRRYQSACADAVERFGGHVGKWLGDGMLAYFGYPLAHEDDSQRAIRAGLEIVAWAKDQQGEETLVVRVGVHTGLTVVGEMGSGERVERADVVGETPNIAARVQSMAPPNAVVMSAATERLAHGYFSAQSLGMQELRGVSRPIEIFRVTGTSAASSRLDAAERLTPLVGREQETALLLERWRRALHGSPQVVVISGEPGIGKSRLARALHEDLPDEHLRIELQCSQFHQNSALYPLVDHYQRLVGPDDGAALDRLAAMLAQVGLDSTSLLPLFAGLLGLPLPKGVAQPDLTPEQLKQRTYDAALAWLDAELQHRPVLLTCEDLHWVDPSTLELISMLVERADAGRLLLILTCRPEFLPPWPQGTQISIVPLSRLGRGDAREVMSRVAGGRTLPAEVVAQIAVRTDGVPLFVEELTKMVLESGLLREEGEELVLDGPLPELVIPDTLQDSLMARLDRLGPARDTAQLGATLGREFSHELLAAVSPLSSQQLGAALEAVVDSGLAYRRGSGSGTRYVFKHALVQDAAYNSLLRSTRVRYHQRIADALVRHFRGIASGQPEVVAHHYSEAGATEQAVFYWHAAGVLARQRSADQEAIAHLSRGLALLEDLAPSADRDRMELELQVALGPALRATRGYTGAGVEQAFSRARELAEQLGDRTHLLPALWGLWSFHMVQAHHQTSSELAERCLELAKELGDPGHIAQAHRACGTAAFWVGDFAEAKAHNDEGARLYDRAAHASYTLAYGIDVGVGCLAWSSWATWYLGYPDEALGKAQAALNLAETLSHPFSVGLAHCWLAALHSFRRENDELQRHAEIGVRLAEEHGIAQWLWFGSVLLGRALSEQGDPEKGIATMRTGVRGWLDMGACTEMPHFMGLLAEAHIESGDAMEAATLIAEGLRYVAETGERYYAPELYRLRGEVSLTSDRVAAERDFMRAIELSRAARSRSLELRATVSLARMLRSDGRSGEVAAMLTPAYAWFTEGLGTRDLVEAQQLLSPL